MRPYRFAWLVVLFVALIGVLPLQASPRITGQQIYGVSGVWGDCKKSLIVVVEFTYVANTNDSEGLDWYSMVLYDANGYAVAGGMGGTELGGSGNGVNIVGIPFHAPTKRPFTVKLHDITQPFPPTEADFKNGPVIASYTFDPVYFDDACRSLPLNSRPFTPKVDQPPDTRLNWNTGDLQAVIYPAYDDQGDDALHVYGVNSNSRGYFLFAITPADLAPYQDVPPAENTLIHQVENVAAYVLTTGEIQLNIGPDAEGKVWVVIIDGLPATHVYSYQY